MNELKDLSEYVANLDYDKLPPEVIERAKMCVLNIIGCALLGAEDRGNRILFDTLNLLGGADVATVVLSDKKTSAFSAALANAAYANVTELAEGVSKAVVHPGTVIVPVVLAESERSGCSGRDLIVAVVAGYEALIRLGWSMGHEPGKPLDTVQAQSLYRGWYPPAVIGALGAAAAVGRLQGLSSHQILNAFGICGNLSPTTLLASFRQGAMAKALGTGLAAGLGLYGAVLAESGYTGVDNVHRELFPLLVNEVDFERINDGLGTRYEIMTLDIKFFACGPVLSEVECGLQMMQQHQIRADHIDRIEVDTNGRTALLSNHRPVNSSGAKFSAPYCIAQVLLGRRREEMMTDAFSMEAIQDPAWHRLADRVELRVDPDFDRAFETVPPRRRPTRIALIMQDGTRLEHSIEGALGLPMMPPTREDFLWKFNYLAGRVLPKQRIDEVSGRVLDLEQQPNIHPLMQALATG
ncbi:MAG: MmgE/PrpD family protein [Ardenticatenaceae bacterium]|nr:MmgE/PrpD family protein [Ardenticatenaceae bacterium]